MSVAVAPCSLYAAPTSRVIEASPVSVITGAVVSTTLISKVPIQPFVFSKLMVVVPKSNPVNSPESVMVPTDVFDEDHGAGALGVVVAVNVAVVLNSTDATPLTTGIS